MAALQEALAEEKPKKEKEGNKKLRLVAHPSIEPDGIAACFAAWLTFCGVMDLYETLVPPAGCPQTWTWRSRPQAHWLVAVAGLFYDLIKNVCRNTKIWKTHIRAALDLMLKQGKLKVRDVTVAFEDYKDKVDLTVRILLQMYRTVKYQEVTYKQITKKLSYAEKKKLDLVLNEIDFGPQAVHEPGTLPPEMAEETDAECGEDCPILVSPRKKMESVFDKVLAEDPTDLVKGKGRQSDKEAKKSEIASLKHYDPAAFDWSHDDAVEMFKSSAFSPTEAVKKEKKVKVQKVNKKPSAKVDKKPASKKTEKKNPKKPLGEQIVNLREIKFRHVWTYI